MAFGKSSKRPQYSVSTSIFVRKGKYIKGPSFGLWDADSGPMARGSVKDNYLTELREFLAKAEKREQSVSFSLFKNKAKKKVDEDDDDDDDDDEEEEEEEEEDEEEEDEEEEEEKPAKKKAAKKSSKSVHKSAGKGGKKSGKKGDWDFDDEDDD